MFNKKNQKHKKNNLNNASFFPAVVFKAIIIILNKYKNLSYLSSVSQNWKFPIIRIYAKLTYCNGNSFKLHKSQS